MALYAVIDERGIALTCSWGHASRIVCDRRDSFVKYAMRKVAVGVATVAVTAGLGAGVANAGPVVFEDTPYGKTIQQCNTALFSRLAAIASVRGTVVDKVGCRDTGAYWVAFVSWTED